MEPPIRRGLHRDGVPPAPPLGPFPSMPAARHGNACTQPSLQEARSCGHPCGVGSVPLHPSAGRTAHQRALKWLCFGPRPRPDCVWPSLHPRGSRLPGICPAAHATAVTTLRPKTGTPHSPAHLSTNANAPPRPRSEDPLRSRNVEHRPSGFQGGQEGKRREQGARCCPCPCPPPASASPSRWMRAKFPSG